MKKLILALFVFLQMQMSFAQTPSKNWVSVYVWDAFSPLILEKTIPEMLISLEIIFQQYMNFQMKAILNPSKKFIKTYGVRSTEGHYMLWLHMDPELLKKYGLNRNIVEDHLWVHANQETDLFTGWSGEANFKEFIVNGVSGLAKTVKLPDGKFTGNFQGFTEGRNVGNSDFAGGFYISDDQVVAILKTIQNYPGRQRGYSFLSTIEDRPNSPYEPKGAQGGNGFNCIDFIYMALANAQVITQEVSESFKVKMWYPEYFWDHTIPLKGSGKKVYQKFHSNSDEYMSREDLLKMAWFEMLFSGINIFDERKIADYIILNKPQIKSVRIWDQTESIKRLEKIVHFKSKRIVDELDSIFKNGQSPKNPVSFGENLFDFRKTRKGTGYAKGSARRQRRGLRKEGLTPQALQEYQSIEFNLRTE